MLTEITAYDTFPTYPLAEGHLLAGYAAFGQRLVNTSVRLWTIDGMSGVAWGILQAGLQEVLAAYRVVFIDWPTRWIMATWYLVSSTRATCAISSILTS